MLLYSRSLFTFTLLPAAVNQLAWMFGCFLSRCLFVCHANLSSQSDIYRNSHSAHQRSVCVFSFFACLLHAGFSHVTAILVSSVHIACVCVRVCKMYLISTLFATISFSAHFLFVWFQQNPLLFAYTYTFVWLVLVQIL